MATLDLTEAVSRIRLACGDVSDISYLSDDVYQWCIDTSDNENAAIRKAAQLILAQLAYGTHSRLDKIEIFGQEAYQNYLSYVKQVLNNPMYASIAGVYVGGMNKDDVIANKQDDSIVQQKLPVYPYNDYSDPDVSVLGINQDRYY